MKARLKKEAEQNEEEEKKVNPPGNFDSLRNVGADDRDRSRSVRVPGPEAAEESKD